MTLRPNRLLSRALTAAVTGAALSAALVAPVAAHDRGHHDHRGQLPAQIDLPVGYQPEGIAVDKGPTAYLGSRTDGDVITVNLKTGQRRLLAEGPGAGSPSIGLKVDDGRVYVAGGGTGTARILSTRSGRTVADVTLTAVSPTSPSFVNDVVLTKRTAWFTDSRQPQLYAVERDRWDATPRVRTVPLTGDWVQVPEVNNANGIALSPDRKSLLVVQSSTGLLFRVNPWTGVARQVDLGGALLTNGDGLLVKGRTLYAVQNRLNQVAVVHLDKRGSRGRLVDTLTSADLAPGTSFDVPTTVAEYKGSLFLPNARFGNAAPLTASYWISRLIP